MDSRLLNRFRFYLERWLQGGVWNQLLFVAGLILLVSVLGGLLAWMVSDDLADPLDAIWWSFLRLSDPGYLGDDEGAALRIISTIVTVLGYVLFLGSLIAILTQWLNQTMRRLESGLTPITISGHIVILGWTNRTPHLIRELIDGQASPREGGRQAKAARIVILAEDVGPQLRHDVRETLGKDYSRWKIILRSGSALKIEHLKRVDYEHASVIIIPGSDYAEGGHELSDARVVKALMTIARYLPGEPGEPVPEVIAEVLDSRKAAIAERAYPGRIEVVGSDSFISRLIAQNVRHRDLSHVYSELLTYARGNEFYVRPFPEMAGVTFVEAQQRFSEAILLGIIRSTGGRRETMLNPPPDVTLEKEDMLVAIARSFDRFDPLPPTAAREIPAAPDSPLRPPGTDRRRILLIGWNHRVPSLLSEFAGYTSEVFQVDMLSVFSEGERERDLATVAVGGSLHIRHIVGDLTDEHVIAQLNPQTYDTIVLLGHDWLESGEESDARTILGTMVLRDAIKDAELGPNMIIELMDPANSLLVRQRAREVIISPVVLSHLLAHISLRRELSGVFAELFGRGGSEIFFRPSGDYGLAGKEVRFRDVRREAIRHREIALGFHIDAPTSGERATHLNPPPDRVWRLSERDRIIVLTTY